MQDTRSAFFTPDSLQDEPVIVSDASEEDKTERYEDTHTTSHYRSEDTLIPHPPSLKSVQIQELMAQLPSKIIELSRDVKELKKHVRDMEIELPGDLKEIPKKLETFTSNISSLTSQTLDALPSLLHKVTDTLNKFATIVENASSKAIDNGVPSAGHANASPVEGEKNTNQDTKDDDNSKGKEVMSSKDTEDEETKSDFEDDHANLADTMTESSKQKKLKKFCFVTKGGEQIHLIAEKIEEQKRIEESLKAELAKQEVEKGPITLKVYREDGTNEVISNLKVSDLHLAEWMEVVQACLNRKEKGWKTIYGLIKTRMEYLDKTKKKLKIDFKRPLKEQDPLDELNDLANKKRKKVDDLKDHSRYLEDQDHLHFYLCGGIETEDKSLATASVQLG
ncbi:hypothetical protein Tco_0761722 [Tanacetum coccineum]